MNKIFKKTKAVLKYIFGTKTIEINYRDPQCFIERHGNKFDLKVADAYALNTGHQYLMPLGVSMTLPQYYAGVIIPRSSTFIKYGILQGNSIGEIEWDYADEWNFIGYATKNSTLERYSRVCQFDIRPVFDAPWYVKLGFVLAPKFKFKKVEALTTSRKGLGSTGN